MLSYTARKCHAPPMTNAFLTKLVAAPGASRAGTRSRVHVVNLVNFRAEI